MSQKEYSYSLRSQIIYRTEHGYKVFSSDIVNRGYNPRRAIDVLKWKEKFEGNIITNPPYRWAIEFVEHALELIEENHKVAMFLKLTFLEGKRRRIFFDKNPPKTVYVWLWSYLMRNKWGI